MKATNIRDVAPGPLFFEFFLSHKAGLLTVDNYGQNALHLILDPDDEDSSRSPLNDVALKYLIANSQA